MYGRIVRIAIIISLVITAGAMSAQAQTSAVAIDFSFIAGGKTLAAGNWVVDIASDCKVVLTPEKGGAPTELSSIKTLSRKVDRPEVIFDVVGSARFLSEVLLPGKGGCQVNRHSDSMERQSVKGPKPAR
jgi:hypothetical protein